MRACPLEWRRESEKESRCWGEGEGGNRRVSFGEIESSELVSLLSRREDANQGELAGFLFGSFVLSGGTAAAITL